MKRHIATPVVAAAVAAGLLVTAACSGDSGSSDDGIATAGAGDNAQPGDDDPEPDDAETDDQESEGDGVDRPVIELPDDMVNVFEDTETGDPVKDAIIADVVAGQNAVDLGLSEKNPEHEAVEFYFALDALGRMQNYIESAANSGDAGRTWRGTVVYYDFRVDNEDRRSQEPIVTFCSDRTGVQIIDLASGEPLEGDNYAGTQRQSQIVLEQNDLGVWQGRTMLPDDERGDQSCAR